MIYLKTGLLLIQFACLSIQITLVYKGYAEESFIFMVPAALLAIPQLFLKTGDQKC